MKLIVGLGNPGKKYQKTRHNLGFRAIDKVITQLQMANYQLATTNKFKTEITKICSHSSLAIRNSIILAKPQTFMNNSGQAVAALARFYKINPSAIWVIYDDIDLPLGSLRIRQKGGSAGHQGVQSIIDCLASADFVRFRVGSGPVPPKVDPADYVLSKFSQAESPKVNTIIKHTSQAIIFSLKNGVEKARTKFNQVFDFAELTAV